MNHFEASSEPLVIAGVRLPQEEAVDALCRYPHRTPWVYDLLLDERQGLSSETLLGRTRRVSSRLSATQLRGFAQRAESAQWDERLADADLADLAPGGELWDVADALYLHFFTPRIAGVGFAKVHKYLHLVFPEVFPILDSRARSAYGKAQRALATTTGLSGSDHWRRRTWLAIGADIRSNRESGALRELRDHLDRTAEDLAEGELESELLHVRRVLALGDLRLLDMLTWKVLTPGR